MGTLDQGDVATTKPQSQKRRSKKSVVWDHFTIKNVGGDCLRACCKQCNKSFAYSTGPKLSGTSHLKRHIDMGICSVSRLQNQIVPCSPGIKNDNASEACFKNGTTLEPPKKQQRATNGVLPILFDQKRCNQEIARMIILHDYPLDMVEHPGFIDFVHSLQPQFEMVRSDTIYDECLAIYSKEKMKLSNLLSGIPGRVSLSLNLWTSDQTLGYAVLRGHFIDSDWTLHRRLLNVVMIPFPDSEVAFNQAVVSCLSGWGLENKLFALALDRSFASEDVIGNLRGLLSIKNPHMLNGQFLVGSCYAHILSSLALDSIKAVKETVQKVRDCVKYVKTSELHEEKFMEIKQQLQVPSKKCLVLDNHTRWDSTYHMLSAASELREVFSCLDTSDRAYRGAPSMDEWNQIEMLCDFLKRFYDAANILTGPTYPTADKLFSEVCTIQLKLFISAVSEDPLVSSLIKPLIEKFEGYWKDCSFVLAMAVVMDPRYKLKLVGQYFSELYGEQAESFLRAVEDGVYALYLEYVAQSLPSPSFDVGERHEVGYKKTEVQQEGLFFSVSDSYSDLDIYIDEIPSNHHTKSDLDHYLEECLYPTNDEEDFKILDWWKENKFIYPTLSKMAADLLSMPLATVPHDCVFDTVRKKVDGSLEPTIIETLACSKDWLQSGMHSAIIKLEL